MPKQTPTKHFSPATTKHSSPESIRVAKRKERIVKLKTTTPGMEKRTLRALNAIWLAEQAGRLDDTLDDETRQQIAETITADRATQRLATVSPTDLGYENGPKMSRKVVGLLSSWKMEEDGAGWPGSFEEGLVAIYHTNSVAVAKAIAKAIAPEAPERAVTTLFSGRQSKHADISNTVENRVHVDGSGAAPVAGKDATETKQTKASRVGSAAAARFEGEDDDEDEVYDDDFLGPVCALYQNC